MSNNSDIQAELMIEESIFKGDLRAELYTILDTH